MVSSTGTLVPATVILSYARLLSVLIIAKVKEEIIQSHRNREGAQTCRSVFFSPSDFFRPAAMPVSPTATAQPAPVTTQDTIPASASTLSLENSKIVP
jgi:hypothetical protein